MIVGSHGALPAVDVNDLPRGVGFRLIAEFIVELKIKQRVQCLYVERLFCQLLPKADAFFLHSCVSPAFIIAHILYKCVQNQPLFVQKFTLKTIVRHDTAFVKRKKCAHLARCVFLW